MALKNIIPFRSIPVLAYHKVDIPDPSSPFLISLTAENFRSHLKYLYDHNITPISLDRLLSVEKGSEKNYVAITFDDGYRDNYLAAYPILQDFNFVATIFLLASFVGKTANQRHYLTQSQIKEMQKYGISFQSHTCTHPNLTQISEQEVKKELEESRKILEDILDEPVRHLSYPYGAYNDKIMRIASEAKYEAAYAAGHAPNTRFARERFDGSKLKVNHFLSYPIIARGWGSYIRTIIHSLTSAD